MARSNRLPVALYVPNLIGYARIALTAIAFTYHSSPWHFLSYYSVGFLLDGADGLAARRLNQASLLGAQLDMVTDRCATAALLTLLAVIASSPSDVTPSTTAHLAMPTQWQAPLFFSLILLDGYSHWMQMVAGAFAGKGSHKAASRGFLLRLYYRRAVLAFVCLLNEACLLAVYMLHMLRSDVEGGDGARSLFRGLFWVTLPVCVLKQVVSMRQVVSAHETIVDSL